MPLPLPHVKELRRSLSENEMYITAFPFTFNHHNYIVLFEDLRQLNEGSTYYGARITFIDEQDNQRILRVQVNANGFDAANSVIFDYFEINANGQSGRALQMLFDALNHSTPAQYTQIPEIFDTLPRLKSWDSTSTRPLAVPVLRLSVTAWCPTRRSIFTQGSPFGLIPCGIY